MQFKVVISKDSYWHHEASIQSYDEITGLLMHEVFDKGGGIYIGSKNGEFTAILMKDGKEVYHASFDCCKYINFRNDDAMAIDIMHEMIKAMNRSFGTTLSVSFPGKKWRYVSVSPHGNEIPEQSNDIAVSQEIVTASSKAALILFKIVT